MKSILVVIAVLFSGAHGLAAEEVVIYGHSDSRSGVGSPTVMDKFINFFNEKHATKLGFSVVYRQEGAKLDEAYRNGAEVLKGADIVQVKDAVNLGYVRKHSFFASLHSTVLSQNIPVHLRSEDGTWFAMSKRARAIYYHASVDPRELSTYEALGDAKWKDSLCLRQSSKSYNKALVAFFMDLKGVDETFNMISSWVANNPFITNTDMRSSNDNFYGTIQAIHRGKCDVGVANTYYLGFYEALFPNEEVPVKIFIPENVHVNVASFGVLRTSTKKENAQKFLEWMSSVEAQEFDSANSNNYPTNPEARLSGFLKRVGRIDAKENKRFNLERVTGLKEQAYELALEAGWSDEPTPVSE